MNLCPPPCKNRDATTDVLRQCGNVSTNVMKKAVSTNMLDSALDKSHIYMCDYIMGPFVMPHKMGFGIPINIM